MDGFEDGEQASTIYLSTCTTEFLKLTLVSLLKCICIFVFFCILYIYICMQNYQNANKQERLKYFLIIEKRVYLADFFTYLLNYFERHQQEGHFILILCYFLLNLKTFSFTFVLKHFSFNFFRLVLILFSIVCSNNFKFLLSKPFIILNTLCN